MSLNNNNRPLLIKPLKWIRFGDEFLQWMNEDQGNVIKLEADKYIEQCTQWKREFTYTELFNYFIKEFTQN